MSYFSLITIISVDSFCEWAHGNCAQFRNNITTDVTGFSIQTNFLCYPELILFLATKCQTATLYSFTLILKIPNNLLTKKIHELHKISH